MLSEGGKTFVGAVAAVTGVAAICLVLRLSIRFSKHVIGADDYILAFAFMVLILHDTSGFLRKSTPQDEPIGWVLSENSGSQRWLREAYDKPDS